MKSKRGMSDVVSVVLIILLVVAAIAVLGRVVLNMVNRGGSGIDAQTLCNEVKIAPTKCEWTDPLYAQPSGNPAVMVQRKAGSLSVVLNSLSFVFYRGVISESRVASVFPNILETKKYQVGDDVSGWDNLGSLDYVNGEFNDLGPDKVIVSVSIKDSKGQVVQCPGAKEIACVGVPS